MNVLSQNRPNWGEICPRQACPGLVWQCCLVEARRSGPAVIVIWPTAVVITNPSAELVGLGQW